MPQSGKHPKTLVQRKQLHRIAVSMANIVKLMGNIIVTVKTAGTNKISGQSCLASDTLTPVLTPRLLASYEAADNHRPTIFCLTTPTPLPPQKRIFLSPTLAK